MTIPKIFLWTLFITFVIIPHARSEIDSSVFNQTARNGKVFSLFSVVQFKNSGCRSQSAMSSGQSTVRNGTCYTSSECASKGGTSSGNCAAGFGVCCIFLVSSANSAISQNCTYIRNPSFPTAYSGSGGLTYTINKCSSDVCYLRLDFETFTLLGPTVTTEVSGGLCPDSFRVTTSTGQAIPVICGQNTGQHIYVDIGTQSTDSATLAFTFTGTATTRNWEIKVSQITCSNPNRPPNGCLQYWTTLTGRMTTFNFIPVGSSHLASQQYTQCIRRAAGYCCIQYQVCNGVPDSFSLDSNLPADGVVDTNCGGDYTLIPGAGTACNSASTSLITKFCGNYLHGITAAVLTNQPICDCTAPFQVGIFTDALVETAATPAAAAQQISRGQCLDFQQVPCTNS